MLVVCLLACSENVVGSKPYSLPAVDTSALTPEIAKSLTPGGLFVLRDRTASNAELTESQVRTIARAWVRQYFPSVRGHLETQRGARINAANLTDCARIYYGESPYNDVADLSDGGVTRRVYGPWWLVPLCAGGAPVVLLGVSAYATDITISNGVIRLPMVSGGEFVWKGIPEGVELPISPEKAAEMAANWTNTRVASIPRLILPNFRAGSPALARWQMDVTPAVTIGNRANSGPLTKSLFVGPSGPGQLEPVIQRSATDQPATLTITRRSRGKRATDYSTTVTRKPDLPVRFAPVEVTK